MRTLCVTLMMVLFLFGGLGIADDRCPLVGQTYLLDIEGTSFELSGFECAFGPGCQSECDLWFGNFDIGPKYYLSLPFSCMSGGDVFITVGEIKIPCAVNSQGDLECLFVDVTGYHCVDLGGKTWCVPDEVGRFEFIHRE